MTSQIKIDLRNPDLSKIKKAAKLLAKGEIVAIPTETVYGLGANALDENAVKKIFTAKGRPQDNPLIVHIANKKDLQVLTKEITPKSQQLIDAFWPGPLTILFKKRGIIPDVTTADLDTVAIRMPHHKVALALIKATKVPLAAPSANLSGKPSPTTADHVAHDLSGKIAAIVDSGPCEIGVESTVIDATIEPPQLLRPGGITKEQIEHVIGPILIHSETDPNKVRSPGMKYKHYSPDAEVIVVSSAIKDPVQKIKQIINEHKGLRIGVIAKHKDKYESDTQFFYENKFEFARSVFDKFRSFEKQGIELIIVQGVKEEGIGLALMNRIKKAATDIIEQ